MKGKKEIKVIIKPSNETVDFTEFVQDVLDYNKEPNKECEITFLPEYRKKEEKTT